MEVENQHIPTPKTPTRAKNNDLSRDDRLRIQTLYYTAGWSIEDLRLQFPFSRAQIDYALENRPTPQKTHSGRRVLLNTPTRKELV